MKELVADAKQRRGNDDESTAAIQDDHEVSRWSWWWSWCWAINSTTTTIPPESLLHPHVAHAERLGLVEAALLDLDRARGAAAHAARVGQVKALVLRLPQDVPGGQGGGGRACDTA